MVRHGRGGAGSEDALATPGPVVVCSMFLLPSLWVPAEGGGPGFEICRPFLCVSFYLEVCDGFFDLVSQFFSGVFQTHAM